MYLADCDNNSRSTSIFCYKWSRDKWAKALLFALHMARGEWSIHRRRSLSFCPIGSSLFGYIRWRPRDRCLHLASSQSSSQPSSTRSSSSTCFFVEGAALIGVREISTLFPSSCFLVISLFGNKGGWLLYLNLRIPSFVGRLPTIWE